MSENRAQSSTARLHRSASISLSSTRTGPSAAAVAAMHRPRRVHEIPFPLLSTPPQLYSAPSSPLALSPASSTVPLALLDPPRAPAPEGRMGSSRTLGKLRKVQKVEENWELWRPEDWEGYSGKAEWQDRTALNGPLRGERATVASGEETGYADLMIMPLDSDVPPRESPGVEPCRTLRDARDLSGDTTLAGDPAEADEDDRGKAGMHPSS